MYCYVYISKTLGMGLDLAKCTRCSSLGGCRDGFVFSYSCTLNSVSYQIVYFQGNVHVFQVIMYLKMIDMFSTNFSLPGIVAVITTNI